MTDPTTTSSSTDSVLGQEYSISTDEFIVQLYISIPVGIALMVLYCIVRKVSPKTWEVRRKYSEMLIDEEDTTDDTDNNQSNPYEQSDYLLPKINENVTYPMVRTGFLNWMKDVWTMETTEFYKHAGFDALVFKLYLKACMWICIFALPYALLVLIPIYATASVKTNPSNPSYHRSFAPYKNPKSPQF